MRALRVQCVQADWSIEEHCHAVSHLVNLYANEPIARGTSLSDEVLARLPHFLRTFPTAHVFLAINVESESRCPDRFVGIAVCVRSTSTFAASAVMNIHDLAVCPAHRGQGVGSSLLEGVELAARQLNCCKVTLEVHRENHIAIEAYRRAGFADGTLAPAVGEMLFLEKPM